METVPREQTAECSRCGTRYVRGALRCPGCGQVVSGAANSEPRVGTRIRDYLVIEKLGEGGMGRTYLTRHTHLGSYRVVKIMHPWVSQHPDFPVRFRREAQLLANLHHPAIVTLHEFSYLEDGTPFMVMEYLKGETLAEYLVGHGSLSLVTMVDFVRQLAQGLDFAHKSGIIHRDISPENIILVEDESGRLQAKLIDFGIAKVFEEPAQQNRNGPSTVEKVETKTGIYVGKPGYGSPEQFRQLPGHHEIDGRTDIFSMGIVMYEMLTGRQLFARESITTYLLSLIMFAEKGQDTVSWTGVPGPYQEIICKCIAYKPEQRFFDFASLLEDLDQAADRVTEMVHGGLVPEVLSEQAVRRHKKTGWLMWALVFILAMLGSFYLKKVFFRGPEPQPTGVPLSERSVLSQRDTEAVRTEPGPTPSPTDFALLDEMVRSMEAAYQRKHYTIPEEGSAFALARQIMAIDPGNSVVQTILTGIVSYYRDNGLRCLESADFKNALLYFQRAGQIWPTDEWLALLITHTEALRRQYAHISLAGLDLVLVPTGSFTMGSAQNDTRAYSDELPRHKVNLSAFYLSSSEVTNGQYCEFCAATGRSRPAIPLEFQVGPDYFEQYRNYPVVNISWEDARSFAAYYGARLPTEAEWERACRSDRDSLLYPWGNSPPTNKLIGNLADKDFQRLAMSDQLVFSGYTDGYIFTAPVRSFIPNAFGLYDLEGNVREWCADYYSDNYYEHSPSTDPKGPATGRMRVVRGGSWSSSPQSTRCSFRQKAAPDQGSIHYGFRLARDFQVDGPLVPAQPTPSSPEQSPPGDEGLLAGPR
ncbi:SUMF1/EgtB/PvdO family nonheme iron enzyme [bacterium]|nr:SUMF1/EgtB/PvdO family nonheme iron enzyme [bacterium]